MTYDYDAIVIGAGTGGLAAGIGLKQGGKNYLILDKKDEIGLPVRSTGAVSMEWVKKIGQGELVHGIHGIQSAGPEIFPNVFFLLLKNFLILKTAHTSSMIPKGQVPERKP